MNEDANIRRIASEWHDGQWSKLYALASSGAILPGVDREINKCLEAKYATEKDRRELRKLLRYVNIRGERDPVPGWSKLIW